MVNAFSSNLGSWKTKIFFFAPTMVGPAGDFISSSGFLNIPQLEPTKLRALRAHVPTCFPCLRALVPTCLACLHAHVPMCLACLHAYVPCCLRANVPCVLTCSPANVSCVFTCSRVNVPCVVTCSSANVPTCSRAITTNNKNKFSVSFPYIFVITLSFFFQAEAFNGCYGKLWKIKWFDFCWSMTLRGG